VRHRPRAGDLGAIHLKAPLAAVALGEAEVVKDRGEVTDLLVNLNTGTSGRKRTKDIGTVDMAEEKVGAHLAGEFVGVASECAVWDSDSCDRLHAASLPVHGTLYQMTDRRCSSISSQPRHRVVALVLPGVLTFDLGCAIQVFARAPGMVNVPGYYDLRTCGPMRTIRTGDGFSLLLGGGLEGLRHAETVIVPGYGTWEQSPAPRVLEALRAAADGGARMMSICVGAFALAHAGVLDGHRATTHWMATAELAARFPRVQVVPDVLYVDDGEVLTSAGIAAGLDLGLHIVRRDHGAEAAAQLARFNVVAPHRAGGQAQYVARPIPVGEDRGLSSTRAWALEHLEQPLSVTDLAAHACCSERTLTRRFHDETGLSPKQWLRQVRLERARELLETTALPIENVSAQAGFPSAAALRARFAGDLDTTPTAYRRAFRGRPTDRPPRDVAGAATSRS
jgi:transcriptional regulator GlxA family with amidase domain